METAAAAAAADDTKWGPLPPLCTPLREAGS